MNGSKERNRILAGGLLIAAAVGIGAASGEWTPTSQIDAPVDVPVDLPLDATVDSSSAAPALTAPAATPTTASPAAAAPTRTRASEKPAPAPAPAPDSVEAPEPLLVLEGGASWYSDALAGRATASGEPYDPREFVAAHRALPFGTRVRVTNLSNDRSVEVRVVDRGPFVGGRIIDLSRSAAEQIGIIRAGHGRVRVEVLSYPG